jgi:hypothetical protein
MWLTVLASKLRGLLRRDAVIDDIDEELRSHVELVADEHVARGVEPAEARRLALASFGNVARTKEDAFDVRGGGWLDAFWQDLRYGARGLARNRNFAIVALLLASIGVYALLSHRVQQMTSEIGVRLALGAAPGRLVAMIVWRGMRLVLAGSLAGLGLALVGTRWMSSVLFGVTAADPLTLVGVPALLAMVALVACYVPALRATRVDPVTTLRAE